MEPPPVDVPAAVREALCYELGYEMEDLADSTLVWSIGLDSLDLACLQLALEDELDVNFRYLDWHRQVASREDLTVGEFIAWCDKQYQTGKELT